MISLNLLGGTLTPDDGAFRAWPVVLGESRTWNAAVYEGSATRPGPVCRDLSIDYDGATLRFSYDLVLPVDHPVYQAVERGRGRGEGKDFVASLLGRIWLSDHPLVGPFARYGLWYTTVVTFGDPVDVAMGDIACGQSAVRMGRIRVQGGPERSVLSQRSVTVDSPGTGWQVDQDRIRIRGADGVYSDDRDIESRERDATGDVVLRRAQGHDDPIRFTVGVVGETGRERLLRWATTDPYPLGAAVDVLGTALIYLLLAAVLGGLAPLTGIAVMLRRAVLALLALAVSEDVFLMTDLLTRSAMVDPVPDVLAVLGAVVWWPTAVAVTVWPRAATPRVVPVPRLVGLGLATVATSLGALVASAGWWRSSSIGWSALAAAAGALAAVFTLAAIGARTCFAQRPAAVVATLTTVLSATLMPAHPLLSGDQANAYGATLFAIGVLAIVGGACVLAVRLLWTAGPRTRGWGLPMVGLFGLSTAYHAWRYAWDERSALSELAWSLPYVASWTASAGYFLAFGCLLVALWRMPGGLPARVVRWAGTCFAATAFYWDHERLFFVPVSIVLGAFLVHRWALAPGAGTNEPFATRAASLAVQARRDRGRILAELRLLDATPPATTLSAGENHLDLVARRRALEDESHRLPGADVDIIAHPPVPAGYLRSRIRVGGWGHGAYGAGIAVLISLPWLAIYLRELGAAPARDSDFPLLAYLNDAGWIVLQWPIFGFFFGYFYPYLRGASGFAKCLTLFVTVWAPPLLYLAVTGRWDLWRGWLLYGGQLLVFAMVLGVVVGDLRILAQVGLRVRHLRLVYRWRLTLAWGTTLVVALSALLAAVLTGSTEVLLDNVVNGGNTPVQPRPQPTIGR